MDTITYDDFAKLQIVVGTITTVELVEDSNKLLKLTVDIGTDTPRQILSGIRKFFADPQTLVGVQTPFLINLETKVIAGLESQGMILAASSGDTFSLLTLQAPLPAGSQVR
jgi:methionyl-tRNA synthetase